MITIINTVTKILACVALGVIAAIAMVLVCKLFANTKTFIKNKIQQLKIKQYAVTYLNNPKCSYIDNKNDDSIKVFSFGTYKRSTKTIYIKARSKPQAIAKFYFNSTYRINNYYSDVLIVSVEEIDFAK